MPTVESIQINKEIITISPALDFSALLKEEQSIARLTNTSGDYSQIVFSIRGFGDNAVANTLILVDGFPITNPSLLAPNFNALSLANIEKIDITQGSEGVLWGDQAVGGIMNITLRHPEKFSAIAYLGVGNYSTYLSNMMVSNKFSNGLFIKALGFFNSTHNYREHNQQKDDNAYLQFGKDYAKGTVWLSAQIFSNHMNFPGGLSATQYHDDPQQATDFINHTASKINFLQFFSQHALSDIWLLETRLAQRNVTGNGFLYSNFDRNDILHTYGIRLAGKFKEIKLLTGYEGQISAYRFDNAYANEKAHNLQNNIFLRTSFSYKNNVELIAGGRIAQQLSTISSGSDINTQPSYTAFVSELGLAWYYHTLKFFLRHSGNFRFPKANEEAWLPQGVSYLKLQTGVSFEGGVQIKSAWQDTQISLYQLNLFNEIAYNPTQTPEQPFGSYNNFPKTRRNGVTIVENIPLRLNLAVNTQINYVDAYYLSGVFAGKQIPAVPALNANFGITYTFYKAWKIKYSTLFTGTRYPSLDETNIRKLPSYWLQNLALQYIVNYANISFEILNIFNKRYPVYVICDPGTKENNYYSGADRHFLLTLKLDID